MKQKSSREIISPLFQASFITLSAIIIISAFIIRVNMFKSEDEPVVLEYISPHNFRLFGGFPLAVKVGLQIDRFHEFSTIKNQFQFAGHLWFEYPAGALPTDFFDNFKFERGTILSRSSPEISVSGNKQRIIYALEASFGSNLIFSDFPVDDHQIDLVLTLPFASIGEVSLEALVTDFIFEDKLLHFGWSQIGRAVEQGYRQTRLSDQQNQLTIQQPTVTFSLKVERYGIRSLIAILLPIFLIYYLIFFALSVETSSSVTVTLGCITGLLAYRYVIEQLSPQSGDLMLSDFLFFLLLAGAISVFLLNKIDIFFLKLSVLKKKIGVVLIHSVTSLTTLYLLFY